MTARRPIPGSELEALFERRRASAEAATRGRAHRALPLDEVERRARAARQPWPNVCPSCNTGTHGNCDCHPGEGSETGIEAEPAYRAQRRLVLAKRPTYTWAFVTLLAILCAYQWVQS